MVFPGNSLKNIKIIFRSNCEPDSRHNKKYDPGIRLPES